MSESPENASWHDVRQARVASQVFRQDLCAAQSGSAPHTPTAPLHRWPKQSTHIGEPIRLAPPDPVVDPSTLAHRPLVMSLRQNDATRAEVARIRVSRWYEEAPADDAIAAAGTSGRSGCLSAAAAGSTGLRFDPISRCAARGRSAKGASRARQARVEPRRGGPEPLRRRIEPELTASTRRSRWSATGRLRLSYRAAGAHAYASRRGILRR